MSSQTQHSTTAAKLAKRLRSTPVMIFVALGVSLVAGAVLGRGPVWEMSISGQGAVSGPIEASAEVNARWSLGAPVELDEVEAGELLWKSDQGLVPLPVERTTVELDVTGVMVYGRVTQRFANPSGEAIEALYVFPLPEGAAVQHMEMVIGERRIVSRVRERAEARREYEQARREGRRAALVEQRRPNLFTNSVANIQPGETIEVVLEYVEEASQADGEYSLAFPMTYTPRFYPPDADDCSGGCPESGASSAAADRGSSSGPENTSAAFVHARRAGAPRASVMVRLRSEVELDLVESGSHAVTVTRDGSTWQITPVDGAVAADRDFTLRWVPRVGREPQAALYTEERPDGRYGLMMILPPTGGAAAKEGLSTETLFVVDVSGSMQGPSIRQARAALLAALDRLRPGDRFNVLEFNDDNALMRPEMQAVEGPESLTEARHWVRALDADGGTMILPALRRALAEMRAQPESSRAQRIVFLTDGAIGNEDEIFAALSDQLGGVRLHTIGIGAAPNRYLMRKMARFGRGLSEFVAEGEGAENKISTFFERIDRPVMSDLALTWQGLEPRDIYPRRLPDLHAGEPLVLSFRLAGPPTAGAVVGLQGRLPDGPRALTLAVPTGSKPAAGVAARWARARVAHLMDRVHEGADADEVRAQVVRVGKTFHLVTQYTSLVAVEQQPAGPGDPRQTQLANADPASADEDAELPSGGTNDPLYTLLGALLLALGAGAALAVSCRPAWRAR